MKYVVKFISVVVMTIAVVYTFFINGEISQYGFWLWTLAVVVSLLTLVNIASLVAALNAEDKQDEKGMLIVSSFLGFLVYSGIFFFTVTQELPDWTYLACCFLVYLISSGFNSRTWSLVFIGLTQYIFFCEDCFIMNTWHCWGVYVLLMILHVAVIFFVIADRMESDPVPPIELVGLLIPVIIFVYALSVNSEALQVERNKLLILCCILFSLLSSIRDATNVFVGISTVTIIYLLVAPCSIVSYLLVLIGVSSLLAGIVHTLNKSILISLLNNAVDNNNILASKYKGLISEYNDLVSEYNGLANLYVQGGGGSGGTGRKNPFLDGVLKGAGAEIAKGAIKLIDWFVGS